MAQQDNLFRIIDVKTGQPRAADQAQVMIYMYLLPLARPELQDATIKGQVVYGNHNVDIEPEELDQAFIQALQGQIRRLAAREPGVKVPSWAECQFCDISGEHCPERVEAPDRSIATTDRF